VKYPITPETRTCQKASIQNSFWLKAFKVLNSKLSP